VLLDTIEALGAQRDAIILIGAHAIYLHTGSIELAVAEYTTDADVALDPALVRDEPKIEAALTTAGFRRGGRVGAWVTTTLVAGSPVNIEVDLMVAEAVSGSGRRAARLSGHAIGVARKARGLEAALIDRDLKVIGALSAADRREFHVAVAGPAALMVTKRHKISERMAEHRQGRLHDKDALDVFRLLQTVPTLDLVSAFSRLLAADLARAVTSEALTALDTLFSHARATGAQMAERAAAGLVAEGQIAQSCAILSQDVLAGLGER
jgi:hypothetical protein